MLSIQHPQHKTKANIDTWYIFIPDIENIYKRIGELELLTKQTCDVLDCRIEAVLDDMSLTPLCDLPEDEPITVQRFIDLTTQTCSDAANSLTK